MNSGSKKVAGIDILNKETLNYANSKRIYEYIFNRKKEGI